MKEAAISDYQSLLTSLQPKAKGGFARTQNFIHSKVQFYLTHLGCRKIEVVKTLH
jgi:hypothetical protein